MFAAWMIGFLVLMGAIVWVAVIVGLPQPWLGLAVLALLAIALVAAVVAARRRRTPPR